VLTSLILIVSTYCIAWPCRGDPLNALDHVLPYVACLGSVICACELGSMLELGGLVKIAVEFDARMLLVGVVHFVGLVAPWVVLQRDLLRLEREERA